MDPKPRMISRAQEGKPMQNASIRNPNGEGRKSNSSQKKIMLKKKK